MMIIILKVSLTFMVAANKIVSIGEERLTDRTLVYVFTSYRHCVFTRRNNKKLRTPTNRKKIKLTDCIFLWHRLLSNLRVEASNWNTCTVGSLIDSIT